MYAQWVLFIKSADVSLGFFCGHHAVLLRRQMKVLMFTVFFSKPPFCYLLLLFYLSLSFPSHSDTTFLFWVLVGFFFLVSYYHCKHYNFFGFLAGKMWWYFIPFSCQVISHDSWSQRECTHSLQGCWQKLHYIAQSNTVTKLIQCLLGKEESIELKNKEVFIT